ncbi:MAG: hypothetical protein JSS67_01330 [Bacteroidetes bacterium]|nr:hypothetical protein [Bacteroidota bacterium]
MVVKTLSEINNEIANDAAAVETNATETNATDNTQQQQAVSESGNAETPIEADDDFADYTIDAIGEDAVTDKGESEPQNKPINYKELFEKASEDERREILESFGIDPFALKLNEHIKKGGAAEDYITMKGIDYSKMPHEKLIIDDMVKQYPFLSSEEINELFENEYKQGDNYTEEENRIGAIMMKANGEKLRSSLIKESENYKLPEAKAQSPQGQQNVFCDYIQGHDVTKNIQQSKRVVVDTGYGTINIPVQNPVLLTDIITNKNGIGNKYGVDKQGYPDVQLIHEMALFKANPMAFKKALVDKGVKIQINKNLEEGQNISSGNQSVSPVPMQNKKTAWGNAKIVPYSQAVNS